VRSRILRDETVSEKSHWGSVSDLVDLWREVLRDMDAGPVKPVKHPRHHKGMEGDSSRQDRYWNGK
jgi:hypothetical protein